MIGFVIPVAIWPGSDDGERRTVDAIARWDTDTGEHVVDVRIPQLTEDGRAETIVNVRWQDLCDAFTLLGGQRSLNATAEEVSPDGAPA